MLLYNQVFDSYQDDGWIGLDRNMLAQASLAVLNFDCCDMPTKSPIVTYPMNQYINKRLGNCLVFVRNAESADNKAF